MSLYSLGLDFGTESVRAVIADIRTGQFAAQDGVIDGELPSGGGRLPTDYALQHPQDWLDAMADAVRKAVAAAIISPADIIGIGVDFTSCTMLPALADGTPLCLLDRFNSEPLAWPSTPGGR